MELLSLVWDIDETPTLTGGVSSNTKGDFCQNDK
jgi:hypothetical protein